MKVAAVIDSLKGSLSSLEAGEALKTGILRVYPDAEVSIRPLADGGEGTVEALAIGMGGKLVSAEVCGPRGKKVSCTYGILEESKTAIIEMAGAAGITLVDGDEKNPWYTTTYGVGEVIRDAITYGCRRFIVGIGGSSTNDGGVGMLQALGFGFLDEHGDQIPGGAGGLSLLAKIDMTDVIPELFECSFRVACDVTNPLCGEFGASAIYGPQKGADPEMVEKMDALLKKYAELSKTFFEKQGRTDVDPEYPGTGAAGGMGFAFRTFTNAVLESGIQIILDETHVEDYIREADIVVTGEGRLDSQTVMGKAPSGVASIAKKYGKPVLAFSGCVTKDAGVCNEHGIDAFFPILRTVTTLEEALAKESAAANMADTAEQAFRLVKTFRR